MGNQKTIPQECEVSALIWVNYRGAKELLTYDLDKQTLESAYNYLTYRPDSPLLETKGVAV